MGRRARARASGERSNAWRLIARPAAAAGLGLTLGIVVACDDPEPAPTTCSDWLRCYVDCRDGQYARGDDQAVDREVLLDICENECLDLASQAQDLPVDVYLAVENPQDVGFFWETMSLCLSGDG